MGLDLYHRKSFPAEMAVVFSFYPDQQMRTNCIIQDKNDYLKHLQSMRCFPDEAMTG